MKEAFTGYYAPTQAEYERLWKEGLIVLDTNVLLDLYRYPASARDDLLTILDTIKKRLWVPYHVALEFQRRRLTVISGERKATEDALKDAGDLFEDVQKIVNSLQVDKRGLGIDPKPLMDDLKSVSDKLVGAMNSVHKSQLDIAISDPIRDRLDKLLADQVGESPADQAALDALVADGEERFSKKVPPGYEDVDKDKNPNEATFLHDGMSYQRKYGDLIIWRQLIVHAKANKIKSVLLVTSDRKEDWWWREKGKTIGPRPELAREILKAGGVELFWMYSSDQFLESAQKFIQAKVSENSVSEIKEVIRQVPLPRADVPISQYVRQGSVIPIRDEYLRNEQAVFEWLVKSGHGPRQTGRFPDFITMSPEGVHGYEVKILRHPSRMAFSPAISQALMQGYIEVGQKRLSKFSLILVVERDEWEIMDNDSRDQIVARLDRLQSRYPIYEIVAGYVTSNDEFLPVATRRYSKVAQSGWVDEIEAP